ncbi:MAG: thioredoxin 1 [Bacteroidales bacterium]|jgi:thioredoxin 1|nr:thioredoxin 1 [Bacteroidales bacterium]MDN5330176.1 thioredoxin 1 [Bacteroidales bacterium]
MHTTQKHKSNGILRVIIVTWILTSCILIQATAQNSIPSTKREKKYNVTFIELGSVRCIPCQKMQPVLRAIEQKYKNEVKVVFYDVWTPEGKPFAEKYRIKLIPTQVFLDDKGKEFYRHEGYLPQDEVEEILQKKGININNK